MNEITNTRITQNFPDTRVLTFIFMEKIEKLQEMTFKEKTLFLFKKKKHI